VASLPSWIWACLFAPFIGSFLGVVVVRHDAVLSALAGRSACPECGAKLSAWELVPVLSWVGQGGRCRHCRAPVSFFYPAIELAALGVAVWSACLVSGLGLWASCCLGWTLIALAAMDIRYFLLPDFLTLPLIAAGLLANALLDRTLFFDHALGAVLGYVFVRLLRFAYRSIRGREGMGMGDAKLLAAAGAWVSWTGLPSVLVLASLLGLVGVLAQLRRGRRIDPAQHVPFGACLGAGLWLVWLYGPLAWRGAGL
jgi:leader peptidase (prepilin peptidase)/N-methyltransferase